MKYHGILDCFEKTIKKEGPKGLWAGLPMFYMRVGPHAVITLLTAEYLRKIL
jgi:solute carrier family 25 oxoglutarate transporter 11